MALIFQLKENVAGFGVIDKNVLVRLKRGLVLILKQKVD